MRITVLLASVASATLAFGAPLPSSVWTNGNVNVWSRDGAAAISFRAVGGDRFVVRHSGACDWSFNGLPKIEVRPREVIVFRVETAPDPEMSSDNPCRVGFVAEKRDGTTDYSYFTAPAKPGQVCERRLTVPEDVKRIRPRVTGVGSFSGILGPCVLMRTGCLDASAANETIRLENDVLAVSVETKNGELSVTDKRTGRTWEGDSAAEKSGLPGSWKCLSAQRLDDRTVELLFGESGRADKSVRFELDGAEVLVTLDFGRETPIDALRYPYPFATQRGDRLLIPRNEGMGYPVDEEHERLSSASFACGHWLSMHFFGVTEDATGASMMGIVENPEDATLEIYRLGTARRWAAGPGWIGEFGKTGYPRRVRYVFFSEGGHVAVAKRFREYAKACGWLKPFSEKMLQRPNVRMLPGAPNIWAMIPDKDRVSHAKELKELGVKRFLWSAGGSPETVRAIGAMENVLVGRYDVTQDVYHPALMTHMGKCGVRGMNDAAWPHDVMWTGNTPDTWRKAWGIEVKEGTNVVMDYCATLCDVKAPFYQYETVYEELKRTPYTARFLDTTFSEPWKECANPAHRQTRRESHFWRRELLRMLTERFGLVTGSERGSCSGVPVVDYFEGMMSIAGYNLPRAGRDIQITWTNELPKYVQKYQVGAEYRLPLWELVFHDCCCAHWYWGDTQNKAPEIWDRRTLFNILYATSPMFLYNEKQWPSIREHVAETCRKTIPIGRAVWASEMTDHRILTPDRLVQRTVFSNGIEITVNFSDRVWMDERGHKVAAGSFAIRK